MRDGKTLTFIELADEVDWIQVPILQRDYAQGREEASDVRRQFLQAIKHTLLTSKEEIQQPLDLDFIYGNFEGGDNGVFSVLDGQQRLTTLFLLHWYLAAKDNVTHVFQESFLQGSRSKFTYKTRTSATEFFNALARADDVELRSDVDSISKTITDKRWFFLSWKGDPTVQSCLRMLDSIHGEFSPCGQGLYRRLTNINQPYIVFQYLNLQSFGLSDELYIKMNARGKPLTDFENFKAWLCGKVENFSTGKQLEVKLDQSWTDIFWNLSRTVSSEFDELYLRFFNLIAFFRACEATERSFVLLDQAHRSWIGKLRTAKGYVSTDELEYFKSFDELSLERVESVLDYFSTESNSEPTLELLETVLIGSDYVRQAKFYAICLFIENSPPKETWTSEVDRNFSRWKRVTNNLINNHRIDELPSFIPSIRSLKELSSHCDVLYEFLAGNELKTGFSGAQRDEEALKARLILQDSSWEPLFEEYERHPYLQGKIDFLLKLAEMDDGESYDAELFEEVGKKTSALLDARVLNSVQFILQRALLSLDDYLVQEKSNRYTFCAPNRNTYRERSENWLKVVYKPVFTELLNSIDDNVEESLQRIIENANCGGWRELLVKSPEAIRYCGNRLVYKIGNLIYLLTKSTFRGYHAELRTFVLERALKNKSDQGSLPDEIKHFRYSEVYGSEYPYVFIELSNETDLRVGYNNEGFFSFDSYDEEGNAFIGEIPETVKELIQEVFPEEPIQ